MTLPYSQEGMRKSVRELPPLPQVVSELLIALQRDNARSDYFAGKLATDMALTAKVLKVANSPFYGVSGRVSSVSDAINVLGLRMLGAMVTTASVAAGFKRHTVPGFDFDGFWRHAIGTALCAQSIAQAMDRNDASAYVCGLLHDIGRLALVTYFPTQMEQALAWAHEHDCPTEQAEQQVFNTTHAEVGAMIAEQWRFGADIVQAIRCHHEVNLSGTDWLADVTQVADAVVHALDLSSAADEMVPSVSLQVWGRLHLDQGLIARAFDHTESQVHQICEMLTI